MYQRIARAFLMIISLFATAQGAYAIDSGGIGGTPANPRPSNPRTQSIFIYDLNLGEQTSDGVRVSNTTTKQKTIIVYAVDSVVSSGGAFACAQKVEARKDVGAWISLAQDQITLEPQSSETVPFNVLVPARADVGEHDGCIVIQDVSADAPRQKQGGVVLSFRSAIRAVVTVPGKTYKKLSFTSLQVKNGEGGVHTLAPAAKNDGNVSIDTDIAVRTHNVFDIFSLKAYKNGGTYPILPRSTASWNFDAPRAFWGGLYQASVTASFDPNTTTQLGEPTKTKAIVAGPSALYWAAPQPLAFAIEFMLILLVIGFVARILGNAKRRKQVATNWVHYKVKSGDTIKSIAARHAIDWQKLAQANKLKAPYDMAVGSDLKVPATKSESKT